jgi:hypothetical protein
MITREHGSWAVFGVPLVVAGILGREWFPWLVVFGISSMAVFMSYVPVQALLRRGNASRPDERRRAVRWAAGYLGIGVVSAIPLLLGGWPWLAAFGIGGAGLFSLNHRLTRNVPKTIPGDLAAVAGLTLTGPAGLYVANGSLGSETWLLWFLFFAFFAGTIIHVHMKIAARAHGDAPLRQAEQLRLGRGNLLYQSSAISSVVALAASGAVPWMTIAAYMPMAGQAVYGTFRLKRLLKFKNLGLALLGQSLLFGSTLAWVLG